MPNPSSESVPRDEAEAAERAMLADPSSYRAEEIVRDGGSILIRAIRPDDKALLSEHFHGLSSQSVYFRFMGAKRDLSEADLRRLTEVDFRSHVGLVATLSDGGGEHFIGVGRYIRTDGDSNHAEVAFAVLDEHQRRGIGTILLEHLRRIAQAGGIDGFEAEVLSANKRMLDVFAQSGFKVARSFDSGTVHVYFPIRETPASIAANYARERAAAAESIGRLLTPKSVAIVGASRQTTKIGGAILANLRRDGFNGSVYAINSAGEVQGQKAWPSISDIGEPIDLAVICVPESGVEAVLDDCARAHVRNVVVIASGFAEVSEEGRRVERRLCARVRAAGMRMVGPNCMGIVNTDPAVKLNASFAPVPPSPGNVAMFSQSGALGISMLDYATTRHLGVSSFISAGNRADVSSNDCLAYWGQDPRTAVIVLYLESFGNPIKFARTAPEIARIKPIVAVKAGRSASGKRAATSHSAALANLDVAVEALFEQAGVIRTNTLEELFDVVSLLSTSTLPKGPKVGVVTNAGGPGILLADACEAHGLELPKLNETTLESLRAFLPVRSGFANPIDMSASASAEDYVRTVRLVGNDPGVDSVVVIYIPPMVTRPEEIAEAIARGAAEVPAEKPVLSVFLSSQGAPERIHAGSRGIIPTYAFPENAALALGASYRYSRFRDRPHGNIESLEPEAVRSIRAIIDNALVGATRPRWLAHDEIKALLDAAGVAVAQAEQTDLEGVRAAAERIGFPLVAKAIAPGIFHKTDVGGVIMDIASIDEAEDAGHKLQERMIAAGTLLEGVLLQRQIIPGIEMLVGMTSDPTFGPLLLCGMGGISAELQKDVAFRLTPVSDLAAAEMLSSLRMKRLFDGYRGAPPGDRAALIKLITRLSALIEIAPELSELDLNPVKVLEPGQGAVVIDARMRIRPLAAASTPQE